jgi:hypothetical protein
MTQADRDRLVALIRNGQTVDLFCPVARIQVKLCIWLTASATLTVPCRSMG